MIRAARCETSDVGREAVYAAEEAAFGGTDFDAAQAFADLVELAVGVVDASWWRACGGPSVELVTARAGAASSSARPSGRRILVRLAAGQRTAATVAHELAHALAGVAAGHGDRFRAAHVDIVAVLAGGSMADDLRRSYTDHGVPPGARGWPPPHRAIGPGFVIVP